MLTGLASYTALHCQILMLDLLLPCLLMHFVPLQFKGQTVLIGVDDMDLFKGIELKLLALERVLDHHAEWRGRLVLVQVSNPPR